MLDFAKKLGAHSSLTAAQIETLHLYRRVLRGEITSKEAAGMRTPHPVKLGTYYRVLDQAMGNLHSSIWTALVGLSLGLVRVEDLKRLIDHLPATVELDEPRQEELLAVIEAIVRSIVTQ